MAKEKEIGDGLARRNADGTITNSDLHEEASEAPLTVEDRKVLLTVFVEMGFSAEEAEMFVSGR